MENSAEGILRFGDGNSEAAPVDPYVGRCLRIAAEVHKYIFCLRDCWYNFIGPYVAATFAKGNAIPGISKEDTETRLVKLICEMASMEDNTFYAFLESPTRTLPQEMIRFERSIMLDGDAAMDMPHISGTVPNVGSKAYQGALPEIHVTNACIRRR